MDEMLSMSLWIIVTFMTVSFTVNWFSTQSDFPTGLGLVGLDSNGSITPDPYINVSCKMEASAEPLAYATCFINKVISPVVGVVDAIWKMLTSWTHLLDAIFVAVPAGDLFAGIIIPFLGVIEVGAAIVILMRLAAIIRGVAGGFL